jgi:Ion channel
MRTSASAVAAPKPGVRLHDWRERVRDPSLTALLIIQLSVIFVAAPLAALGLPWARPIGEALVLALVLIIVTLSNSRGAIVVILIGLLAILAHLVFVRHPTGFTNVFPRGGSILMFGALTWVVARAVYAPGRITLYRVQGAVVLYLNFAIIFGSAFRLMWDLIPTAFANLAPSSGFSEIDTMLYFSLTALTTTGFGDIAPVHPFARSLANLEAIIGQLYPATILARLVTLELEHRRR